MPTARVIKINGKVVQPMNKRKIDPDFDWQKVVRAKREELADKKAKAKEKAEKEKAENKP